LSIRAGMDVQVLSRHDGERKKESSHCQRLILPCYFLLYIRAKFALVTVIPFFEISFISKPLVNKSMSDIRSLSKFIFGNIENTSKII